MANSSDWTEATNPRDWNASERKNRKPVKNVIMIMLDTLQHNYLGCYGNDWFPMPKGAPAVTPNIDRFAKEATLFENMYIEGLPTIPCRRAMMTGRYTLHAKGWGPLDPEDTTVADMLWGRGIHTGLIFDTPPMRLPKFGYQRGFYDVIYGQHGHELDHEYYRNVPLTKDLHVDDYLEENCVQSALAHPVDERYVDQTRQEIDAYLRLRQNWKDDNDHHIAHLVKKAIKWLEERDRTFPFMLWIDSFDPHEPWESDCVWKNEPCMYDPDYKGKHQFSPIFGMASHYTEEQLHHIRMLYATKVHAVDKYVGILLDAIKQLGLWDNTMIILTTDHGQPLGNGMHGHGLVRKVRPLPYEELVHGPLIIHLPGAEAAGKRIKSFVQSCDIAPTILDFMGALEQNASVYGDYDLTQDIKPGEMHGASLLPLITGEKEKIRNFAIAGYFNYSWSYITEDYSYIHWLHKRDLETKEENDEYSTIVFNFGSDAQKELTQKQEKEKPAMWSCTPGNTEVPDQDELYDRRKDRFQLVNIIKDKPAVAQQMLEDLKSFMGTLKRLG